MTDTNPSLSSKLTRLKASFITQLPQRIQELQRNLERIRQHDKLPEAMAELHRCWHSLKGSSRIFGYPDLAKLTSEGENHVLDAHPSSNSVDADWLQTQQQLIQRLHTLALQPDNTEDIPENSFQVPFFEMSQVNTQWQSKGAPLIYICDDESEQVEYLAYQLNCFGYRVERFTDVDSFERVTLEHQPDAVVMDVHFPNGSTAGTESLQRLNQKLGRQLPAVVLSALDSFEARLSAWRAGCRSYLLKPAKPLELADALEKLVRTEAREPYQVLIVDDDPGVAEYHGLILQNAGMRVRMVHDPSKVLDVLREFSPDLILIDVYMPVCNGYELAGVIRQVPEYLGMSIIYLSSETDRQKQFNAMQVGVEGFITKPVDPDDLITAVALRAERMRSLRGIMTRDSLTGLYNHSTATEIISTLLAQADRNQEQLMLAALDLDLFKQVNDNYGHLAGDQVLLALSHMLKNRLRHGDVIGRYGGEEFIILLRDISPADAHTLIDRLRDEFSRIVFSAGNDQFNCTFSVGLSRHQAYTPLDELMHAADQALYQAKHEGRNRVCLHEASHE